MSDTHHGTHHDAPGAPAAIPPLRLVSAYTDGGHEVDHTPNRNLFAFLGLMVVLMIAASIGIYQLFVMHSENTLSSVANASAVDYRAMVERDTRALTTWGRYERDGQLVSFRMPIAEAKKRVLANPALFAPAPPPADWVHPDDAR
jgi:hypothetical protein